MRSSLAVRLLLVLSVGCAGLAGPLVAPASAAPEDCFGDGRDLDVGTEGPAINLTVYTSLFTNLGGEGAFGLSAVGNTGDAEILTLHTGVVFEGVGDPADFLADPFSRFGLVFDYRLSLPMLEGLGDGTTYEQSDSPVEGVPEAACSVE